MEKQAIPNWLSSLNIENVSALEQINFPRRDVLQSSVFYPASRFHGEVIEKLASVFHSFIYVDYSVDKNLFDEALKGIRGYSVVGYKSLEQSDLVGSNPAPEIEGRLENELRRGSEARFRRVEAFASWVILGRDQDFSDAHGPERFSLIYICADGAAAYLSMYSAEAIAPRALAIIQPGHGFGGNYTNFTRRDGLLAHIVLEKGTQSPEFLLCGGAHYKKSDPAWWSEEYSAQVEYFPGNNAWSVWRRRPQTE